MKIRVSILALFVVVSGCALVFPPEIGPASEMLNSRYVSKENKQAVKELHSKKMEDDINKACPKRVNGHCTGD